MATVHVTEDVQVNRATRLTEAEKCVLSKCALCGQCAVGRGNEHLLFKCTDARVVEVPGWREEVEAAVERKVHRLVKPGIRSEGGGEGRDGRAGGTLVAEGGPAGGQDGRSWEDM